MRTMIKTIDLFFRLLAKEFKFIFTDEGILMFVFLVPLGYPLLYSWIYNNEVVRDVPVAVVDMAHSKSSQEFVRAFNASPTVEATYYCNNLEEAKALIGKQVVRGVLYFPQDYDKKLNRGEQSTISIYCDMSLMLTYKAIYQSALSVSLEQNKSIQKPKTFSFTKWDEELNTEPIHVEEKSIYNTTEGYGNAILPGVLILILQQTLMLGIGLSAGTMSEKKDKAYLKIGQSIGGVYTLISAKAVAYFTIFTVLASYITIAVPHFFGFTMLAEPLPLICLLVPYLLAAIFFAMIISLFVRLRENVMLIIVFTSIPFLFMSGVSWPLSNIPGFWQGVSWLIPSTFGIRGYLTLAALGGSLNDVLPYCRYLWIQTFAYFFIVLICHYKMLRGYRK